LIQISGKPCRFVSKRSATVHGQGTLAATNKKMKKENIIIFPAEGGVTLYNTPDSSYDKKIWVVDNNGNSGIKIIYWVEFSSWVYVVHILIRSNQPTMKVAQVTVEIERFDKLKDLR